MRIAVIDHVGNYGGGSRVVRALLPAFLRVESELKICYFGNIESIRREQLDVEFKKVGIEVKAIGCLNALIAISKVSDSAARFLASKQCSWRRKLKGWPPWLSGDVATELEREIGDFDIVFFPWPYLIRFPNLKCPVFCLLHDFNFKYYFSGSFVYSIAQEEQINEEIPDWMNKATPILSTNFMVSEMKKFYPSMSREPRVIHLGPLSSPSCVDRNSAMMVLHKLEIDGPFLLYPTNMASHKNIGPLISAVCLLRELGHKIRLVLTGSGTERICGTAGPYGLRLDKVKSDVQGLGYVTNVQMDSLIQCATVVVTSSLYEAGSGPGLDAWGRGVPVAMSNIPAFVEHVNVMGVRAQLFDPRSPADIAAKIAIILDDPVSARADAAHSLEALRRFTWEQVANRYLETFRNLDSITG